MRKIRIGTWAAVAAAVWCCDAMAQPPAFSERAPDAAAVAPLYPGAAPGSEAWGWHEQVSLPPWGGRGHLVRNVVQPTLTFFRPGNPALANRTAVIVAPGGGFKILDIESEGYEVGRALAAQGVTAIVLKYRLERTPEAEDQFREQIMEFVRSLVQPQPGGEPVFRPPPSPFGFSPDPAKNPAVADGLQAVRHVREHAMEMGIDPGRIGMVGFSAGAIVVNGVVRFHEAANRPDFAAQIYFGTAADTVWPKDTPPMFLAVAADDVIAFRSTKDAFQTLQAQKLNAELHVYNRGGHGWGMSKRGLTTDQWYEQFTGWMASMGLLTPVMRGGN